MDLIVSTGDFRFCMSFGALLLFDTRLPIAEDICWAAVRRPTMAMETLSGSIPSRASSGIGRHIKIYTIR